MLLYGGDDDTYDMYVKVVRFNEFSIADATYLQDLGHDVILCNHERGHTAPVTGFAATQMIEFFQYHPLGTIDTPWLKALPDDYPEFCLVNP